MPVPNTFANATATIPLTQLDANFATTITLGNTAIQLGNTVTTLNNMTLANVNISSGIVTITNASVTTANVTTANIATATIATANVSGNLTFTSTGQRILGDFSNATAANRVAFQSSTTDGETSLVVIPNGTSTTTRIQLGDASNLGGSGNFLNLFNTGSEVSIRSGTYSGGTGLPMTLYTSGTEKLRIAADATGTYTFGGTAPRITGDFSNATVANRVMFQTSTVNGLTSLDAMPNGTSQISVLNLWNSSDPINAARIQVGALSTEARLLTDKTGTGTFLPMTFYTGGSEAMRIDTSGNVGIGTSSPAYALEVKRTGSISQIAATSDTTAAYSYARYNSGATNVVTGIISDPTTGYISVETNHPLLLRTNATERMRIDSSGNVGIGTTSPGARLEVALNTSGSTEIKVNNANTGSGAQSRITLTGSSKNLIVGSTNDTALGAGGFIYVDTASPLTFFTNATERARITDAGAFVVGKTSAVLSAAGSYLQDDGFIGATRSGNACIGVNRLTNDGTLIFFQQAGTEEGSISVSGTTVSYNGGHLARWSQLLNGQRDESILKGTVLSNLDEMCEWTDAEGNPLPNEQLNRMKVSDVEGDTNVAGVFVNWDNDDQDNLYDMNIAMTGDMIIRIAQGVTVQKGDLLMSAGDGTAKPQGDDIVRSKTVAKVTSNHVTCTYEDGSYCVPCVLMAC